MVENNKSDLEIVYEEWDKDLMSFLWKTEAVA